VIEIDLADIKEPIVCCPNDPDDAKFLSEVAGTKIDEAFIGSCMTNIGHFRAAAKLLGGKRDIPVKLWVAPPTKMDESELIKEGHYAAFGAAGARTEMPGCSLCMGNQAQVREGATVMSTSTRNFPNRLGKNTNVFLGSAELAAILTPSPCGRGVRRSARQCRAFSYASKCWSSRIARRLASNRECPPPAMKPLAPP
jgi:aconitate hydratase 2/2-methylisocitrate dehydratase